jgi:hypothetical protein
MKKNCRQSIEPFATDRKIKKINLNKPDMKSRRKFLFLALALMGVLSCFTLKTFADDPLPTVPGQHGTAGDHPVGAPIDSGLIVLLALGAGYGAKKLYDLRKHSKAVE